MMPKIFQWVTVFLGLGSVLLGEEVAIAVGAHELKGTLTSVEEDATRVVFILSGSGPTDRDGNTVGLPGKNNSLKYLSEALNEEGVATLRVDKRGVGMSAKAAGKESDLRFAHYVEDVRHWLTFLAKKGYPEVILVGHSEGALVATAAATTDSVVGLICLASPGRPAGTVLREQLRGQLPDFLYDIAERNIGLLEEGKIVADFPPALVALFRPSVQPYLISLFAVDPVEALSEVTVPILIIQGTTDVQVAPKDAELLHEGAEGSKLMLVEGMNHVLKEVQGDRLAQLPSYFDRELPLHEDLVAGMMEFINALD